MEVILFAFVLIICFNIVGCVHIELGERLNAGHSWKSSDGTFAIGFYPVASGKYNLGVWYECEKKNGTEQKTLVWTALGGDAQPLQLSKNDELELTSSGLKSSKSAITIIPPPGPLTPTLQNVVRASMMEDGNFVLINSSKKNVWKSFESPTNTLLPNQQLTSDMSFRSASTGYSLTVNTGQVFLKSTNVPQKYWSISNPDLNSSKTCLDDTTGTTTVNSVSGSTITPCTPDPSLSRYIPVLNLSSEGVLQYFDGNGSSCFKSPDDNCQRYTLDYGDHKVIRRLTLDDDGNMRIYSLSPRNDSWSIVWQAVLKDCDIFGTCGAFGLCTYRPDKTCSCPPGFRKVDVRDDTKGCEYKVPATCNDIKFVRVNRVDYFYNDYDFDATKIMSLDECRRTCSQACPRCLGFAYKFGAGLCFHKGSELTNKLYNGRQAFDQFNVFFFRLSTEEKDDTSDLFVADTNATLIPDYTQAFKQNYIYVHGRSILLSVIIMELIALVIGGALSYIFWQKNSRRIWKELSEEIEGAPTRFRYKQLQAATENFREILGTGGFGTVFKGNLPEHGGTVAIKTIHIATQAEKQFKAEVNTLGRVHHLHLVRLLGYCAEGSHRLLVYEYMPNGSLDKALRDGSLNSWEKRFSIILSIAKGITYLHEQCHECILHCDIQPQNILLDENNEPKISDFGLAKLMKREQALSVTTIRGTRGYVAPEWLENRPITAKADVYSFGMVLFEILSGGHKEKMLPSDVSYFPVWAFQRFMHSDIFRITDPVLGENQEVRKQVEEVLKVGFWCVQDDADSRPSMSRVVQMLEEEAPMPPEPSELLLYGDGHLKYGSI